MPRFSPRFIPAGEWEDSPCTGSDSEGPFLSLRAGSLYLHFRLWQNECWGIQVSPHPEPDFFTCALLPSVARAEWESEEDDEGLTLSGPGEVFIDRETAALSWYFQGEPVLETETGLGFGMLGEETLACFRLVSGMQFFGLGEKTGDLNRKGSAFTMWNTDAFGYGNGTDPLYVSIPFFIATLQGRAFGLLLDQTSRSRFNFGASNQRMFQVSVSGGPLNLVFIPGPTPGEILQRYHQLTGPMPLPPLWALGLHQCRYSYYPESEVHNVARNFRDRDIPCDVLYLDIHYMDRYRVFTSDPERFPDMKKMCSRLAEEGFRVVAIQDPGICAEPGYAPYESGLKQNVFVCYPDGRPWVAGVWPGDCVFPDFTAPEGRNWWSRQTEAWIRETGVSGLWNDMNEPATWGQDVPDILEFSMENRGGNHREARNIYGQKMAESTREGLRNAFPGQRPFVLTRAGFAGIHRSAAVWTGDNAASEEHLFLSIRLVLSLGMSGVSFAGPDVGGFVGDAGKILFVRWLSVASFFPFFRLHSMIDSRDNEPWSYGEWCEAVARNYIRLRYKLLPYLYSVMEDGTRSGMPVLRPFFWEKPHLEYNPAFGHQFFFGPSVLVIPAASEQQAVEAELPDGIWYHLFTGEQFSGGRFWLAAPPDRLPVFVRAGGILATGTTGHSTAGVFAGGIDLHLFHGEETSRFSVYADEGDPETPRESNSIRIHIEWNPAEGRVILRRTESHLPLPVRRIYVWHCPALTSLEINGMRHNLQADSFAWLDALPNFDPFEDRSIRYFGTCLSAGGPF